MTPLFPYQEAGRDFLAARKLAYLADDMRLGKSAQTVAAADVLGERNITVICPAVARVNWARQFAQFGGIPRKVVPVLARADAPAALDADVAVFSYDMAEHAPPGRLLVVDEAHYLKSLDSNRSALILGKAGLIHHAERAWFLSGTPAPNNPAELWTVLYTCGVTKLPYDAFVARYCTSRQTPYGLKITGGRNLDELRASMAGFLLRRTKAEVRPDMPPILFSDLVVDPGPVDIEVEFYPQWRDYYGDEGFLKVVAGQEEKVRSNLDALEAIAESVPMFRRYVGMQKVKPVVDIVTAELEADPTLKMVLFAVHKGVVEGLMAGLKKFHAVNVYGGTPAEKRQRNVDRFQNDPHCRVFIGNIQAAGTAIALDAAHQGLMVESDWVPGNNMQAAMRMDGPNQKRQITVQFVATANPVDEAIQKALRQKAQTLAEIFS